VTGGRPAQEAGEQRRGGRGPLSAVQTLSGGARAALALMARGLTAKGELAQGFGAEQPTPRRNSRWHGSEQR
jgi:hypothetical protein